MNKTRNEKKKKRNPRVPYSFCLSFQVFIWIVEILT